MATSPTSWLRATDCEPGPALQVHDLPIREAKLVGSSDRKWRSLTETVSPVAHDLRVPSLGTQASQVFAIFQASRFSILRSYGKVPT